MVLNRLMQHLFNLNSLSFLLPLLLLLGTAPASFDARAAMAAAKRATDNRKRFLLEKGKKGRLIIFLENGSLPVTQ